MKMIKLPKTITENEFIERVKKVKQNNIKIAFMLGFYQCLRVSEVVKLKKEDIDMERGFIHIIQAKREKDRDIPIMQPVKHGLRHLPVKRSIRTLQRHARTQLGVKFHTLRHSGATYYLNDKSLDIRFIQQLLGHTRLDTTQIYTHINPKQLKAAFDKLW